MEIIIGKYIDTNSILHKLDPRTKLVLMILLIVLSFLIDNFLVMLGFLAFVLLLVVLSKVPLGKYLGAMKPIFMVMMFTIIFQVFFNRTGEALASVNFYYGLINFLLAIGVIVLYQFVKKLFRKKFMLFVISVFLVFLCFFVPTSGPFILMTIYKNGVSMAAFLLVRIISLVLISSILTLTTKTLDLNLGLEYILSPLKVIKLPASEIALMIAIALRFIPTLLEEANKIIKAQASRGVDFSEAKFSAKVTQIISLLIPMFIISLKRADDLASAMEARAYVPGAKRTRLNELKYSAKDFVSYAIVISMTLAVIVLGL